MWRRGGFEEERNRVERVWVGDSEYDTWARVGSESSDWDCPFPCLINKYFLNPKTMSLI